MLNNTWFLYKQKYSLRRKNRWNRRMGRKKVNATGIITEKQEDHGVCCEIASPRNVRLPQQELNKDNSTRHVNMNGGSPRRLHTTQRTIDN